jgi:hypothetical protein
LTVDLCLRCFLTPAFPRAALVAAMAVGATIVLGCGSDSDPEAQRARPSASAKPVALLPKQVNIVLASGRRYKTRRFEPSLELEVPAGQTWLTSGVPELRDSVALELDAGPRVSMNTLSVTRIDAVADPRRGARDRSDAVRRPADFIAWLQDHPRLQATEPRAVRIAGLEGRQIDVTAQSTPTRMPDACDVHGADCLPLYFSGDLPIVYSRGDRVRFSVLTTVGRPLLVEQFAAPPEQFARVLKLMQPLVDSLKITGR